MLRLQLSRNLRRRRHTLRFSTSANFPSLLSLCKKPIYLLQVHARLLLLGFCENPTLLSQLIETYTSFGLILSSKKVFYSLTKRNSFHYNALLRSLDKLSDFNGVLSAYQDMILESVYPDGETVHLVTHACYQMNDARSEMKIRGNITKLGLDGFCANSQLDEIDGSATTGSKMAKVFPQLSLVVSLLKCSIDLRSLKMGRSIHCVVLVGGMHELDGTLLSMYSKLGSLRDVKMVFERMPKRHNIAWNMLISSYDHCGYPDKSMDLLRDMISAGFEVNVSTILHAFSSIRKLKSVVLIKQMHSYCVKYGLDFELLVHNALINVYFVCGCINYAERSFDVVPKKDLVTWSTMIKGYAQHDRHQDAFSLFHAMRLEGYEVDDVLVLNLLPASVKIGGSELVKFLHCYLVKLGFNLLFTVRTSLLVCYAQCGLIDMARQLFEEGDSNIDIVAWNSMISAYAKHGDWDRCYRLHNQLKQARLTPDEFTFLGLLTACVNSGLVEEGREVFREMTQIYSYQPTQEHYACLVDLLGRAGHMKEACEVIKLMPFNPEARVWSSLLSASKKHKNSYLAETAGDKLMGMDAKNAGNYILLSNIYAAAGRWDMVAKTRSFLKDKKLRKTPGISSIEMHGKLHEFVSGGSHPRTDEIHKILGFIEMETKTANYFLELSVMNS